MIKRCIDDLAYFSDKPMFPEVRPFGQLWAPDRNKFYKYIESIYSEKRITNNGPLVRELEVRLADLHQCKHCVVFANACIAIISVLKLVAQTRTTGEVILPAFTYAGLPHLVRWAGFLPKFVDIDENSHAMSVESTEKVVTDLSTAILAVHQVNSPADIEAFSRISVKYNIPVIYDSVHGVCCSIDGVPLGGFGEAEIFSLHATKLINGFEGGYVTTNREDLARELKIIRNFGILREDATAMLGLNGKLNEIHAALALASLDEVQMLLSSNQKRFLKYSQEFSNVPEVSWVEYPPISRHGQKLDYNYEFFLLRIPDSWPLTRDEVIKLLRAEGALARGYYDPPIHLSSHYPSELEVPSLPVTEKLSQCYIQMPAGELVSDGDIEILKDWFCFVYENGSLIRDRLLRNLHQNNTPIGERV